MSAIFQRELRGFFQTMLGYVYIAFMVFITGILFTAFNLQGGRAEFSYTLNSMTLLLIVAVPILTMRALGDERRQRIDQLLFTAPVTVAGIVMGKFLAIFALFAAPLAVALACPAVLSLYGDVPLLSSYACFLPYLLMGTLCIAIGLFISSFTENPILCAVITFGALFLVYLVPSLTALIERTTASGVVGFACVLALACLALWQALRLRRESLALLVLGAALLAALALARPALLTEAFFALMDRVALFSRFDPFAAGVFSVPALVYYLSGTALMLFLTVQSLRLRYWS